MRARSQKTPVSHQSHTPPVPVPEPSAAAAEGLGASSALALALASASMPTRACLDTWLRLQGVHRRAYEEVVQRQRCFPIRYYFTERWLALLGLNPAWLVQCMRQLCYWNRRQRWWEGSRQQVGDYAGLSDRTVRSYFNAPAADREGGAGTPFLGWFVRAVRQPGFRFDPQKGIPANRPCRYEAEMDEPLTPADFVHLGGLLRALSPAGDDVVACALEALRQTAALPREALLAPDPAQVPPDPRGRGWDQPATAVGAVMWYLFGGGVVPRGPQRAEIVRFADLLHEQIVQPERQHWVTHYFRERWVPHTHDNPHGLGQGAAWLVLALRSRGYWDVHTGEMRNTVGLESWAPLQRQLGVTRQAIYNYRQAAVQAGFMRELDAPPPGASGGTWVEVAMSDPIAPPDRPRYEALLDGAAGGDVVTAREEGAAGVPAFLVRYPQGVLQEWAPAAGQATEPEVQAVAALLGAFGIGSPSKERILVLNPDPLDVCAWLLYVLAQPGLSAMAAGYVVNRLLAGDVPPQRYRRWAQLSPAGWRSLWEADRCGGAYRTVLAPPLRALLDDWHADFGSPAPRTAQGENAGQRSGLFERGPFGDSPHPAELRWCQTGAAQEGAPDVEAEVDEDGLPVGDAGDEDALPDGPGLVPDAADDLLWAQVLGELRLQMTEATFDTWLRDSRLLHRQGEVYVVGVRNEYAREWLEQRLHTRLLRVLRRLTGEGGATIRYVVERMADSE